MKTVKDQFGKDIDVPPVPKTIDDKQNLTILVCRAMTDLLNSLLATEQFSPADLFGILESVKLSVIYPNLIGEANELKQVMEGNPENGKPPMYL